MNNDLRSLKIGTHEYFGQTIETTPIRTTFASCYKVESKSKFGYDTAMMFFVKYRTTTNDTLESIKLYVAANNTWQGVIYGAWPNTKNPLKVIGKFSRDGDHNIYYVPIEVTKWTYMNGHGNYSQCLEEQEPISKSCKSIFHPKSFKFESRLVFFKNLHTF